MRRLFTLGFAMTVLSMLTVVSPAAADSRIVKDLNLPSNGEFTLQSDVGSVTVTGSARSGAHVVITSDDQDLNSELEFSFTTGPGLATVTARRKHSSDWGHGVTVHFEIEVPQATRTRIRTGGGGVILSGLRGSSEAKTSGGPIQVSGLNGNLEANTSGGRIRLLEVTGDAHVETSGGAIEVEALEGNLQAHTGGGGIRIDGVSGYVDARTSGGSIHVNYSTGNRHGGVMETSGGRIEVALDASANLNVDASTSAGSVSSDLPLRRMGEVSRSNLHGTLGSGGEELRLHTSGGSIRIRAL